MHSLIKITDETPRALAEDFPRLAGAEDIRESLLRRAQRNLALLPAAVFQKSDVIRVTIVILSWGRLEQTLNAIRSIKEHVRIPFKLLIVDNGSGEEVQTGLRKAASAHDFIQVVCLPENLGCAGGRMLALNHTATEYVMFMDNDIEIFPGTVEHLLNCLESHPEITAAAGNIVLPSGLLHLCGGDYRVQDEVLFYELLGYKIRFDDPSIGESGLCKWVNGGLTLFRREMLLRYPYDRSMSGYYEDLEWCYRLNQEGEGTFYRSVEAVALHFHESKLPDPSLPLREKRRLSLPYIEAIATFHSRHGLIIQNLFDFIPELTSPTHEPDIVLGKLILMLIRARGCEWLLEKRRPGESGESGESGEIDFASMFNELLVQNQMDEAGAPGSSDGNQKSGELTSLLVLVLNERQGRLAKEQKTREFIERALAERQESIDALTREATRKDRKIKSLVAHVKERQQAIEALQRSRLFRILAFYWRVEQKVRRAGRRIYSAFYRFLRFLNSFRWSRRAIKTIRQPFEFVGRINLILFRVIVQVTTSLPRSFKFSFTVQLPPDNNDSSQTQGLPAYSGSAGPQYAASGLKATRDIIFTGDMDADVGDPELYDVVCLSVIEWEFRFQRPQQLLTQFADEGHRVFYLRTTFHQDGPQMLLQRINERILRLQLPSPTALNLYQQEINHAALAGFIQALDQFQHEARITNAIVLVQLPFWKPLADAVRDRWGWKVIYDCMDEHSGFSTNAPAMLRQEEDLIESSDLVIATSQLLHAKTSRLARRTLLLPNATDFDHFSQPGSSRMLPALNSPIIGYYGAISDWFDVEMVRAAAAARPDWQFVLIGSTYGANVKSLTPLLNVHLLGEQPYHSLPGYLERFDVACIPFLITPLTTATNPVKFYEYLSAGKPVVSVELPELEPYRDYFYPVRNREDFVLQIEAALQEDSSVTVHRRIEFARHQTWQRRYQALDQAVRQCYGKAVIVIVSYNNFSYLQLCLDSIWAKTLYPNYEVIVVDNGSETEVTEYLQAAQQVEPRLKVILNGQNLGFSAANNIGIRTAGDCEYVILLNNDTVVTRGWLSRLIYYLDHQTTGLVGPVTNSIGNEAKINVDYHDLEGMEGFAERYTRMHAGQSSEIAVLAMYCVGIRKAVLDQIGLLDERFAVGMFEDDDYSMRVHRAGFRVLCAEDIFIHHWGGASFKKLDQGEYYRIFNDNLKKFEEKWRIKWKPHQYRAGVS